MAAVTAHSTDDLAAQLATRAYWMHQRMEDQAEGAGFIAGIAQNYVKTGSLGMDGVTLASKTPARLTFTYADEDGDAGTEIFTGTAMNTTGTAHVWTGNISDGTWIGNWDGLTWAGKDKESKTFTYAPANPASKFVLTKVSLTSESSATSGERKDNESFSFAGALTVESPADNGYSLKLNSYSETQKQTLASGTREWGLALTSKAGVTKDAGSFETVSFTYKNTADGEKLNDSYVLKAANAGLAEVFRKMIDNGYGIAENESGWVEISDAQVQSIAKAMFSGDDQIKGGDLADTLTAYAGKDKVDGGAGKDTLSGGTGVDTLTGGSGADTFLFSAGDSGVVSTALDSITDFQVSQGDKIGLAGLSGISYAAGTSAVSDFNAARNAANALMGTGKNVVFEFDKKAGYVFVDFDGNGAADLAIALTGVKTAAGFGEAAIFA